MNEIVVNIDNPYALGEEYALALGNFDGVHLGHQKLIEYAKKTGLKVAIMTFEPHPISIIKNIKNLMYITPYCVKKDLFNDYLCDVILKVSFDINVMKMKKEEFIAFLKKINPKKIICGYDYTFGYMGEGKAIDLSKCFDTIIVSKYMIDGIRVSSTKIREYITSGDIDKANKMLGRPYMIKGVVEHGNALGRTIGFRTANITHKDYIMPKNGVYLCKIKRGNETLYGMANVGYNPTINVQKELRLEVNIFDFSKDIYGETLEIYFIYHLRDEIKFNSKEELIEELSRNKEFGIKYFA